MKFGNKKQTEKPKKSPSMRREWIEMFDNIVNKIKEIVSLHAEGVD